MSKFRKKKVKGLRREIVELNGGMSGAASIEEYWDVNAAELYQRDFPEDDLSVLETIDLQEQAESFGINLFP